MRQMLAIAMMAVGATTSFAQTYGPQCQAPYQCAPACGAPNYCVPTCQAPTPTAGGQAGPGEQPGAFVAGPQSGEVAGESNSIGLRFGSIRIPALTIPFPTVQMPSLERYRRDAHMITEGQSAPYVQGPISQFDVERRAAGQSGPDVPTAPGQSGPGDDCRAPQYCVPQCPPECAEIKRLEQQVAQLSAVVQQLATLQIQQAATQPSAPAIQQPVPVQPAVRPASQSVTLSQPNWQQVAQDQQLRMQSQYQQKCAETEQLRAQIAELQQAYQQMLDQKSQQIAVQREERLRERLSDNSESVPQPMPGAGHSIERASFERNAPTAEPSTSAVSEFAGSSGQYQWQREQPSPAGRVVVPQAEPESKGLLSRFFNRD